MPSALADWGGKPAFYRGILAEQRQEYALAAGYYLDAASDPAAPPGILERSEAMTRLARLESGSE
jgi:hypothetical protein